MGVQSHAESPLTALHAPVVAPAALGAPTALAGGRGVAADAARGGPAVPRGRIRQRPVAQATTNRGVEAVGAAARDAQIPGTTCQDDAVGVEPAAVAGAAHGALLGWAPPPPRR